MVVAANWRHVLLIASQSLHWGCDDPARGSSTPSGVRVAEARSAPVPDGKVVAFSGSCDASGAVPLDSRHFAVADDEDSVLRVYDTEVGGPPLYSVDVSDSLSLENHGKTKKKTKKKQKQKRKTVPPPETDIEAATLLDRHAYWLTSHARKKDGKRDPNRFRFFATGLPERGRTPALVGEAYTNLIDDILKAPTLSGFGLGDAVERQPDEPGGFNLEGLTSGPDGRLWIGFRNPIPQGKALVVPLENPTQVVAGQAARFGPAKLLDLAGRGVRALSWWRGNFLVVGGGATGSQPPSRLYRWDGEGVPRELRHLRFGDMNPEGFFTPETRDRIMVLSDDGSRNVGGKRCKDLKDDHDKGFRGIWIQLND